MPREGNSVSVPWKLLLTAFVLGLLGIAGWNLNLERVKADKVAVEAQFEKKADKDTMAEALTDIKGTLTTINTNVTHIQDRLEKYIDERHVQMGKK
jgi:hypothetical protein